MYKTFYLTCYLIFLMLISVNFSWALEEDRQLAIEVNAEQMSWNNKQQLASYLGQVEATQGELLLKSDLLKIMRNNQGELKQALASNNKGLAYMRDLPQLEEPEVEAWAEEINFLAEENLVILTGKARLIQGTNSFTGHKLTYNLVTQDMQASQKANTANQQERVKAIFTPKQDSTSK